MAVRRTGRAASPPSLRTAALWRSSRVPQPGERRHERQLRRLRPRSQDRKIKRLSVNAGRAMDKAGSRTLSHARFIAFWSDASNLVRGDTNHNSDVFVHDRRTGKTRRVSVRSSGGQGNGDSADPFMSAGAASSASSRARRTWWAATAPATCSCTTAGQARPAGQRELVRATGRRR